MLDLSLVGYLSTALIYLTTLFFVYKKDFTMCVLLLKYVLIHIVTLIRMDAFASMRM